jgi:hypothetical protein
MSAIQPGLLHLHALHVGPTDTHAQHGTHLRVAHHPLLGLPAAPFILERADVSEREFAKLKFREDALFRDQAGNQRFAPFTIGSGDEITVILPSGTGTVPIWVQVDFDPSGGSQPQARAYMRSIGGPDALLGKRTGMPIAFCAPGITKIVLRGAGTVAGVRWLNLHEGQKVRYRAIDLLNLPHPGGLRYAQVSNWQALCDQRRDAQAPRRRHLQDLDSALSPQLAPGFSQGEEKARIETFFDSLKEPLDRLIAGAVPQLQQTSTEELLDASGNNISADGTAFITIRTLGLFLQAQADPGVASLCGYKTLDTDSNGLEEERRLSLYRLRTWFRDPDGSVLKSEVASRQGFDVLIAAARQESELLSASQLEQTWTSAAEEVLRKYNSEVRFEPGRRNLLHLVAQAVGDHRALLEPPEPPTLDKPEHKHWLPAPPGAEIRVTETGVRHVLAGAALAATRRQPPGANTWFPLNSQVQGNGTWRALILPAVPSAGPFASSIPPGGLPDAFLSDPRTGPGDFRMQVAQMDRFGRWSGWASRLGDSGPRPKPPRPVVRGHYQQPAIASGSHSGTVTATVPLPDADTLAPASWPLEKAVLTVKVNGATFGPLLQLPVASTVSIYPGTPPSPADDQRAVQIVFAGPALATASRANLEITAVWHDDHGQTSQASEPLKLKLTDPYPPPQMSIPDILLYSARPDATQKAWVERRWPKGDANIAWAVYYTDENRLREHLRQANLDTGLSTAARTEAGDVLGALEVQPDPAARATLLRAHNHLFPAHLFERLKNVVQQLDGTGDVEFRHALSGSLAILSGYKIVAESADTAVRPSLAEVDTCYYAVPNSQPPAQPVIVAQQVSPGPGEPELMVELTITLRPGVTPAETARIRRTRSGVVDPLRNPIIGTATFGPADPVTGLQSAIYRDNGSALIAPDARFQPFVEYAWLAEAQGATEPGSSATADGPVAGLWSKPSIAATREVVPEDGPVPAVFDARNGVSTPDGIENLELEFTYPLDLVPPSIGAWRITVDRRLPGGPAQRIVDRAAGAGTRFSFQGSPDNPMLAIPEGTVFIVRIIDPLGRISPATEHIIAL